MLTSYAYIKSNSSIELFQVYGLNSEFLKDYLLQTYCSVEALKVLMDLFFKIPKVVYFLCFGLLARF